MVSYRSLICSLSVKDTHLDAIAKGKYAVEEFYAYRIIIECMVTIREVAKLLSRPREPFMELNRQYNRLQNSCDYNPAGIDIFEEDWDTCIILDACRYDVFRDHHPFPGRLERRTSRGGGTAEFLAGNFRDRTLLDVVYVTANPQYYHRREELNTRFHAVEHVWQDEWDGDLNTVHPDTMTEVVYEAHEQYPNKRILAHYNQPHGPYIGPTGKGSVIGPTTDPHERSTVRHIVEELRHELVSAETYRQAYLETFEIVAESVSRLLPDLVGRIIVTSDHGEMLGERASPIPIRYYSHRMGVHTPELVEVPWLVYENGPRRSIDSQGERRDEHDAGEETVRQRLRDLGYAE